MKHTHENPEAYDPNCARCAAGRGALRSHGRTERLKALREAYNLLGTDGDYESELQRLIEEAERGDDGA